MCWSNEATELGFDEPEHQVMSPPDKPNNRKRPEVDGKSGDVLM